MIKNLRLTHIFNVFKICLEENQDASIEVHLGNERTQALELVKHMTILI